MPDDPLSPAAPLPSIGSEAAAPFPYMRWAKSHLDFADPHGLGLSGVLRPAPGEAPGVVAPTLADPRGAFREVVGRRYGVGPERVHPTLGSSAGNFLVHLALARGRTVLAETPAYEALHALAPLVGARLRTFARPAASGWRIDPDALARAAEDGADLIVVSDLHNPSGVRLHAEDLSRLVALAEAADGYVLVDEVYRDLDPEAGPTAARRSDRVLVTNSLTKAHGLHELRAGWILAAPELVAAIDRLDDLVNPVLPPLALEMAARYLDGADRRVERLRRFCRERIALVDRWVEATPGVSWTRPDAGITGLLLLDGRDGDTVVRDVFEAHGVRAVPGSFFQVPEAVRISFGGPEEGLRRGLEALADVLGWPRRAS